MDYSILFYCTMVALQARLLSSCFKVDCFFEVRIQFWPPHFFGQFPADLRLILQAQKIRSYKHYRPYMAIRCFELMYATQSKRI